jgi:hypothetical protein
VTSLCKKSNLTLRFNVHHNGSTLDLSLSQQEGNFSSRDSWWTCAGPRLRCHCILADNFLLAPVSLDGWEGRAALRPSLDDIDKAILQALDQIPFASVQELAKATCISIATVWRRLTKSLGFVVKYSHLVPRSLTEAQRKLRIYRSIELLTRLEPAQPNEWQSLMTLDESWFYL